VSGEAIVCPRHGCTFRLQDGAVVGGPASIPQPSLEARVVEGRVEVRLNDVLNAPSRS
jgi:nitrite reductase/ring-hydroxylating ferredoxin subunit